MNKKHFERLIQTYGCEEEQWPLEHKAQMLRYIHSNTDWLNSFPKELQLDDFLKNYTVAPPAHRLTTNILNNTCYQSKLDFKNLFFPYFPKLSALCAALVLGLCLGIYQNANYNDNDIVVSTFINATANNSSNENEVFL